jgi:hypothetical protein
LLIDLVALVIAGQIGQDTSSTCYNVNIGRGEHLHKTLEQTLKAINLRTRVGQISERPQTVLYKPLTRVPEVHRQSLHTAGINDRWFVAYTYGQH